jgi:hypothetical protein
MGKPTGFIEYKRLSEGYEAPEATPEALSRIRYH